MEKWTKSERPFKGRIFSLRVGQIEMSNGTIAQREVVEHPGGVCVVPVLGDSIVMIRQYRIAVGEYVLELPAGKLEGDEDPEYRGKCELEEETGYRAEKMVNVGTIYASAGYTSEEIHVYLAFDLEEVGQNLEFDEDIEIVIIPIQKIRQMLIDHEIPDAKTIVGLNRLLIFLDKQ